MKSDVISGAPLNSNAECGVRNAELTPFCACGCGRIIPASRNPNPRGGKEYYSRKCKDADNTEARKTGRRVIRAVPVRDEREALIATVEKIKATGRMVRVAGSSGPSPLVDLGPLSVHARLLLLCRASKKMGVLTEMRNAECGVSHTEVNS